MDIRRIINHTRRNTPHAPIQYQAYCDRCRRSFINDRALEQHLRASPRHNVCPGCDFDYITQDEMEECDCGSSAEEDEEGSEYYDYEPGSAGTLSDDGGGVEEPPPPPPSHHLAERFTNTYYSVPGAWNGGTSTGASEASSSRRAQTQATWGGFVDEDEEEVWDPTPFTDPYAWYDSQEYSSGAESASHSELSGQLDESELGSDAGRDDGAQLPVPVVTPYCQRCNREFSTQNGLYQHHRMSALHPWYCWTCKLDHDREVDLQRHVDTIHGGVPQPGSGNSRQQQQQQQQQQQRQQQQQQQQQPVAPPQQVSRWMEEFTAIVSDIRRISGALPSASSSPFADTFADADVDLDVDLDLVADTSTSTARGGGGGGGHRWGQRWAMSLLAPDSPPIIAPRELPQIPLPQTLPRREEVGRDPFGREQEPVLLATDRVSLATDRDGGSGGGGGSGGKDGGSSNKASPALTVSCPLCLDNATALTTTLCGHVFCKECISAAIQHKPECPVCRAFTHIKSLHPIFLNVISSS